MFSHFVDFLKILGQLNFSFHGLVLEILENSEIFYELNDFFTIKENLESLQIYKTLKY